MGTETQERFGIASIFATAHSNPDTRARGERAKPPLGWLMKPFTARLWSASVVAALARTRAPWSRAFLSTAGAIIPWRLSDYTRVLRQDQVLLSEVL
jgi:hypothetical protein